MMSEALVICCGEEGSEVERMAEAVMGFSSLEQ